MLRFISWIVLLPIRIILLPIKIVFSPIKTLSILVDGTSALFIGLSELTNSILVLFSPNREKKQSGKKTDMDSTWILACIVFGATIIFGIIMEIIEAFISTKTTTKVIIVVAIIGLIFFIYRYRKNDKAKKLEKEKQELEKIKQEGEAYWIESVVKHMVINKALDMIFTDVEMNNRLKEFILQHTKRYDNGETNHDDYLNTIDMFLTYVNRKVGTEIKIPKNKDTEEIINYWGEGRAIIIDREMIKAFIENEKMKFYVDDIKNIINIDNYETLGDVIKEYVDIFGEKSLNSWNLRALSATLDKDHEEISDLVKNEHTKVKEEYEIRKLEEQLFKSGTNYKDLTYIDALDGFEFEDFLEELFIEFGYKCKELPYSNDYGADLIISKGFNDIVIQAKRYSGNVSNTAVQEVIAAKDYYKSDIAMVITNSYYTKNAIKTGQASGIILIDRDRLERILNEGAMYFNSLVL